MAVTEDLRPLSQQLNNGLREHMSIYALSSGGLPLWYGRMLTNLVLLAEGEEVEFITGTYLADAKQAHVIVFTASTVIEARVTGIEMDDGEMKVRAIARSRILSITADAAETVFSNEAFSRWPGQLTLTATYAHLLEPLTLPLERPMNGDQTKPVRTLLASLKEDLMAAPRRA